MTAPSMVVGGSAWRNRPLAALESLAREGVAPGVVVARAPADLRSWIPSMWPGARVLDAVEDPAVRHDLAVLHYPFADEDGALYARGDRADDRFDRWAADVSTSVVVTVDEVLTRAQARRAVASRRWDAGEIAEIRHVPYGAFPGSCDGLYRAAGDAIDRLAPWAALAASDDRDRLAALASPSALAAVSLPHGLEWHGR